MLTVKFECTDGRLHSTLEINSRAKIPFGDLISVIALKVHSQLSMFPFPYK